MSRTGGVRSEWESSSAGSFGSGVGLSRGDASAAFCGEGSSRDDAATGVFNPEGCVGTRRAVAESAARATGSEGRGQTGAGPAAGADQPLGSAYPGEPGTSWSE